jgi:predicted O-methyltransferase YrrM
MKKPVIVFPFWCQEEIDQYVWMLKRWDMLTRTEYDYGFLLACRFDFEGDFSQLQQLCEVYGETEFVRLSGSQTGHPQGCNEMWEKTADHLYNKKDEVSFFFYMEYDVVPQDINWLTWFIERWQSHILIMGHYVSEEWLDENGYPDRTYPISWGAHINGAACYSPYIKETVDRDGILKDMAWDVQLYDKIDNSDYNKIDNLTMYEFRISPTWTHDQRDINLMMVHGAKTIEEKQEILDDIQQRDLRQYWSMTEKQHAEPFNADTILQGTVYGLLKAYGVKAAVETGSFVGATTKWLSNNVDLCYGIEVQEEFCEKAKANATDAQVILGSSTEVLPQVLEEIENGPVFFFIDSHWKNEWPLLDELRIIGESKWAKNCIIVIHDYKTGDLGYDSYGEKDLDENYVKSALDSYFKGAKTFTNKDAVGCRRGVFCIINVGE